MFAGFNLELLGQVMKMFLASFFFLTGNTRIPDGGVSPLAEGYRILPMWRCAGSSVIAGEPCLTCSNTKLRRASSTSGVQEQLLERPRSRLQSEAGKTLNLTNVNSLWVIQAA